MRSCRHAALRVNSPTQPMRPHPAARPTATVCCSVGVLCRCDSLAALCVLELSVLLAQARWQRRLDR